MNVSPHYPFIGTMNPYRREVSMYRKNTPKHRATMMISSSQTYAHQVIVWIQRTKSPCYWIIGDPRFQIDATFCSSMQTPALPIAWSAPASHNKICEHTLMHKLVSMTILWEQQNPSEYVCFAATCLCCCIRKLQYCRGCGTHEEEHRSLDERIVWSNQQ